MSEVFIPLFISGVMRETTVSIVTSSAPERIKERRNFLKEKGSRNPVFFITQAGFACPFFMFSLSSHILEKYGIEN